MMALLADVIDPLQGLYQNWPWMLVVAAIGKWFANILDRTATRHITFIDALDKRDQEGLIHQATTSVALGAISDKLSESRSKLSGIDEKIGASRCVMAAGQSIPMQPHGA